jgi:hypothetical protein
VRGKDDGYSACKEASEIGAGVFEVINGIALDQKDAAWLQQFAPA